MSAADQTLPPQGAFVVQFAVSSGAQRGATAGRVEHVESGRASRFRSADELLAFFTAVLAAVCDTSLAAELETKNGHNP
ncbi:MAG: hypothetical protein HYR72_01265 [Deltaproteobacteria bacterium]|nr:hypothetical protein [Deltaproteobacteria bacterium]MBI3391110.1 hypothetical protein [Deltaproteobacteria bacterium]